MVINCLNLFSKVYKFYAFFKINFLSDKEEHLNFI